MHKETLKVRPIVSSHNTITYFASKYLHNILIGLVKRIPTICLNNLEILREFENITLPSSACILCADVQEMYPSIPIDYGLRAVRNIMIQFNYHIDKLEFILELLEWVLVNNYLMFDNNIYLQIKGTAMGTPIAVCYANITLYYLEQSCLAITHPICYKRYIDDLCVLCLNPEQAQLIAKIFNQQVPTIQLTAITIGKTGIFLDMYLTINIKNQIAFFSLYFIKVRN